MFMRAKVEEIKARVGRLKETQHRLNKMEAIAQEIPVLSENMKDITLSYLSDDIIELKENGQIEVKETNPPAIDRQFLRRKIGNEEKLLLSNKGELVGYRHYSDPLFLSWGNYLCGTNFLLVTRLAGGMLGMFVEGCVRASQIDSQYSKEEEKAVVRERDEAGGMIVGGLALAGLIGYGGYLIHKRITKKMDDIATRMEAEELINRYIKLFRREENKEALRVSDFERKGVDSSIPEAKDRQDQVAIDMPKLEGKYVQEGDKESKGEAVPSPQDFETRDDVPESQGSQDQGHVSIHMGEQGRTWEERFPKKPAAGPAASPPRV